MDKQEFCRLPQEDLDKYFAHTIIKISQKSKWKWIGVERIRSVGGNKVKIENVGSNFFYPGDIDIDFALPESRSYNFKDKQAFHFVRNPKRHAYRGLVSASGKWQNPLFRQVQSFEMLLPFHSEFSFHLTANSMNALWTPIPRIPLAEGFNTVGHGGCLSKALSARVIVSVGIHSEEPCLFLDGKWIGDMPNEETVVLYDPIFEQDLLDEFPNEVEIRHAHS